MPKNQSSLTAGGIALIRALESEKPVSQRLIFDPYARQFVPGLMYWVGKIFTKVGYAEFRGPGVMGFLIARERFIDDMLLSAAGGGFQQLVILGAGFDARPYRFQEQLQGLRIYEVDHPATQVVKLASLEKTFGRVPEWVCYVGIDFNTQSLGAALLSSGYRTEAQTFFIWQGVTYYLTSEAVDTTLAFISENSGPGSMVVFDYINRSIIEKPGRHGEVANLRRYRALTGEFVQFGLPQENVKPFLESRGFIGVQNTLPEDLIRMYFARDHRPVAEGYCIASGVVPRREDL